MEDWDIGLAKQFKKRDNKECIGVIVGTVANTDPITVSIYGGAAVFSKDNLYVPKRLISGYKEEVKINNQQSTIEYTGLKTNDKVIIIATQDNQKIFVIDKLG